MNKPFSQSCENNKHPILQRIKSIYDSPVTVWEIGSGTGQHGCYFAGKLPHVKWQCTDRKENLEGINCWIEESGLDNLPTSLALNVTDNKWPCQTIDALFTANTLHIMHLHEIESLFEGMKRHLTETATVCIYGPFNYAGKYTSDSNEKFDQWLITRDPNSGIRNIEYVTTLAKHTGLTLTDDIKMPANNRLLIFQM